RNSQKPVGLIRTSRTIRYSLISSSDFDGLSEIGCFFGKNTPYAASGAWADAFVGFPGIGLVASRLCLSEWSGSGETRENVRARQRKSPGVYKLRRPVVIIEQIEFGKLRLTGICMRTMTSWCRRKRLN